MNLHERPAQRPNKSVVVAWVLNDAVMIVASIVVVAYLIFSFLGVPWALKIISGLGILVILVQMLEILLKQMRWKNWGYDVSSDSVEIMEGVFFVTRTMIPLSAIEHVDTTQSPIERLFHLYSLKLATAAGEHRIPGLVRDQAESLRTHVRLTSKAKHG
jgi:membrane protein YdbS with pleckstrin-like domain